MEKPEADHHALSLNSDHIQLERSGNGGSNSNNKLEARRWRGPVKRSSKGNWTREEDEILRAAVQRCEGKRWNRVAECLPGRTYAQCLHRWQKVLNPDLIKGPWTPEEDALLIKLVKDHGMKNWAKMAKGFPGRAGKQCRERWENHLRPGVRKDPWTVEEERILIKMHIKYGNKWSQISKSLPGRSENAVKNYWNCSLRKKAPWANGTLNHPGVGRQTQIRQENMATDQSTSSKCADGGHIGIREENMKTDQSTSSKCGDRGDSEDPCCLHLALRCTCKQDYPN